jgi:hypothetical protein
MAQTTFSGPVTSNAGFNSDDTLTASDLTSGGYNLTDFTVRPTTTWTGTVAALVGAANSSHGWSLWRHDHWLLYPDFNGSVSNHCNHRS